MLTITLTGTEAEDYLKSITTRTTAAVATPTASSSTTPPAITEERWKRLVDSGIPTTAEYNRWTPSELAVIEYAVDNRSKYYTVDTLCKYLGRSKGAIASAAIRKGYHVSKNYIKSSL